jgi:hypothetical protein
MLDNKTISEMIFPSSLKEGCKGVRVWGVGEDTFFMPGGETCFIGTALCPLPFFVSN